MPTPKKSAEIDDIEQHLRDASFAILADYRGLSVAQIGTLRNQLRPLGAEFRVVKNTLTRIAAARVGIDGLDPLLIGPSAIAFAGDDVAGAARVLGDFARTSRILTIKGGILSHRAVTAEQVSDIASLPPPETLRAQLAGNIQGPLTGFVGLLNGALTSLIYTLDARAEKLGEAA